MSSADFGKLMLPLLALVGMAHLWGHLFARLHQPRVAGEILAGVLWGPAVLGRFAPSISAAIFGGDSADKNHVVLGFLYNLGLLLLMFGSGAETKGFFHRRDRREIAWLGIVGTGLPFVLTFLATPLIPLDLLAGGIKQPSALLLIVSIAMAVTSIPVISRILHDLGILDTRFGRLILGVAVIEDVVLWAVLAVVTTLVRSDALSYSQIVLHVAMTGAYFVVGLVAMPHILKRAGDSERNVLMRASPVGYVVAVLFAYCALAAALDVSLVFAAFLAGYAITAANDRAQRAMETVVEVSFAVFVPVYFAVVGYQLDLTQSFSPTMLIAVLVIASTIKLLSAGLGARLAGFSWSAAVNLSMTLNARGGPGIVLAGVARDLGLVNAAFYTTLVLLALLTSQIAGAWLQHVLRQGWPLLADRSFNPPAQARTASDQAAIDL
jgi:Kef-type K+ transport system membrane component KefB